MLVSDVKPCPTNDVAYFVKRRLIQDLPPRCRALTASRVTAYVIQSDKAAVPSNLRHNRWSIIHEIRTPKKEHSSTLQLTKPESCIGGFNVSHDL